MTGSAVKCFSMNGGVRCVMAIKKMILRMGGGLGEGSEIAGPGRRAGGFIFDVFFYIF